MLPKIRFVLWGLVAVSAAAFTFFYTTSKSTNSQIFEFATPMAPLEGEFKLATNTGGFFSAANLTDKPSVVFFGFTNCPDICPTGLLELTDLLEKLGDSASKLQVLFVAVDSKRDTQPVVADYLTAFDPRIIGLTGTTAEIDAAVKTFKAFYEIIPGTGSDDYSVNHSAGMFLIDTGKRFVGKLDGHESTDVRLAKLQRLIAK